MAKTTKKEVHLRRADVRKEVKALFKNMGLDVTVNAVSVNPPSDLDCKDGYTPDIRWNGSQWVWYCRKVS